MASIVRTHEGQVVKSVKDVTGGQKLAIEVSDGSKGRGKIIIDLCWHNRHILRITRQHWYIINRLGNGDVPLEEE